MNTIYVLAIIAIAVAVFGTTMVIPSFSDNVVFGFLQQSQQVHSSISNCPNKQAFHR